MVSNSEVSALDKTANLFSITTSKDRPSLFGVTNTERIGDPVRRYTTTAPRATGKSLLTRGLFDVLIRLLFVDW